MDVNHGIGKNNQLPWQLSSDLKRFKELTMGHHIIMGRKTYESIARKLPGRKMLILSMNPDYEVEGAHVFHSIDEAIRYSEKQGESEVFIIGGGNIFMQTIDYADRLYLTLLNVSVEADVFFPCYDKDEWEVITSEEIDRRRNGDQYSYRYILLERKHLD